MIALSGIDLMDIDPTSALAISRFVFDGAALFLWGVTSYLLILKSSGLRHRLVSHCDWTLRVALGLILLATLGQLPLHTAILGSGWPDALSTSLLWLVATQTTIGLAWTCKVIITLACLMALLVSPGRRLEIIAISSMVLLASLTISGHSAMHTGELKWLHRANQWVHLLAGGFWLGALFPLITALSLLRHPRWHDAVMSALIRFSRVGHVAVALVILSGALNTWLIVGAFPMNWSHEYQCLLSLKAILVLAMVSIALFNRYHLAPKVSHEPHAGVMLSRLSWLEIVLATLVIALVARFAMLNPH